MTQSNGVLYLQLIACKVPYKVSRGYWNEMVMSFMIFVKT